MRRRDFLKNAALASTSMLVPSFINHLHPGGLFGKANGKTLIIIQLSGGNDGLNTVVPYRNDNYYRNRPTLGIKPEEVLRVQDEQGFNPVMTAFQSLYNEGLLTVINSVGYPNPDRSHFRSMDIWHTASASDEYLSSGWIGRYLDSQCPGCELPYHALELDDNLSLAMKGNLRRGFAMSEAAQLKRAADNRFLQALAQHQAHEGENNVAYLYKTLIDTQSSAAYLYEKSRVYQSTIQYPQTPFGRDLKTIAELITAGNDTCIYYVSLTGFDTHANQKNQQDRLLRQYAEGMESLVSDLRQNKILNDTLILTFSEFGRRVNQNASNGTDHGTANNVFLIGGELKRPGFFNPAPDLQQLDEGDLIYQVDFRSIYATILEKWLNANVPEVLGKSFPIMELLV